MVDRDDFLGVRLKLERAHHHIRHLEQIAREHIAFNVKSMARQPNPKKWRSRSVGSAPPLHTPTILGDAIHNLRSALDHVYCALVISNGNKIDNRTSFPFYSNKHKAREHLYKNGKLRDDSPSEEAINFILDEIRPFRDEGSDLYQLHKLDIDDKHKVLVGTMAYVHEAHYEIMDNRGNSVLDIYGPTIIVPHQFQNSGHIGLHPGQWLKLHNDPKEVFDIIFDRGTFEGERVVSKINEVWDITKKAIDELSHF
ncbi:hypothetical protein [Blastomonas fulva]|uniref:hypothetical protein n=1 Tax=Blastomonas fulva TaxID=1550728 RepID=UPI0025A46F55|nr:hypothetical protein [Blastomonas fulva]MDM7929336.1 hypothetical protein [Blastomonas fulva]MDM7967796.1 hypothetical protein [Blastomonas fulva]